MRRAWNTVTSIGMLAALAIVVSPPMVRVQAQPAGVGGVAVGTRILPSGTGTADTATVVTPDDIAQADAGIAAAFRVTKDKPFMPTDDPGAYAAAKAAASTGAGGAKAPRMATVGASVVTPLAAPTIRTVNYAGLNQTTAGGVFPPNTHGAAGPAHFVQVVDVRMAAFNKAQPGTQLCTFTLAALHGVSEFIFDPRVVYDPTWNRWVFVATRKSASPTDPVRRFFIAVSTTGNPCGSYFRHTFNLTGPSFNAGDWLDSPGLGMSQDAVLITGNVFDHPTAGAFKFAAAIGIAKARLYNGLAFSVPIFTTPFGTLQPPIVYDQNKDAYFLSANNLTHLHLFRGNNLSNAAEATFVLQAMVDVQNYAVPPHARQVGTTVRLDTLDRRFVNASTQIGDSLWNVHTISCGCDPAFAAPRFYEIDTEGPGANTVKQQRLFFESATSDDFNASITANQQGEAFVTWISTDALHPTPALRHQARMRISGRQAADLPGIGPGSAVFTSGVALTGNDSAADPNVQRWGKYSAVTLDPQATSTCGANRRAWAVNEVINSANVWGSRITRTGFCE